MSRDQPSINKSVGSLPEKYLELKKEIAKDLDPEILAKSWREVLESLEKMTNESEMMGPECIPQVEFSELQGISREKIDLIKRRGAVVIRNVVSQVEALEWKEWLREYVKVNNVTGIPEDDKMFFQLYWTKSQVKARAHPNVLSATVWLNHLYHQSFTSLESSLEQIEGLRLDEPLAYADRFRIRHAGGHWVSPSRIPHIDSGGIERWEDPEFRKCFTHILTGKWREHDPYELGPRLNARNSFGRPNAATIFRTFQGWLALSSTSPGEGTLRVFPDVLLSNAYLILRPFFRLKGGARNILSADSWEFDASTSDFPGITWSAQEKRLFGPRMNDETHPHLRLEKAMVSVPRVEPGDMVFWHCDVIHSVEPEHKGQGDSSVMYIPAVPTTLANKAYILRQAKAFLNGVPPPDFPQDTLPETGNKGLGVESDVVGEAARRAMGLVEG